jgi:hypothetical protein
VQPGALVPRRDVWQPVGGLDRELFINLHEPS